MDKFQSLADVLGVPDPALTAEQQAAAPPYEFRLEDITDGKSFALAVLNSREFRQYIIHGLTLGDLPGFAGILSKLMDHGWGKVVDQVEVKDTTTRPEDMTAEQLEARALRLAEMARSIRLAPMDTPTESVH